MNTVLGAHIAASLDGLPQDSEIIQLLNKSRLDLTQPNPDPEQLVTLDSFPICTRGNFSFIIGLPGSRKSFLCTAIAGAFMNENGFMSLENANGVGRLLWFDTEQSSGHVARIGRRLDRIAGFPIDQNNDNIIICMLREHQFNIRRRIVKAGIEIYKPDFVVIDGLSDLISNPNDPEQADSITTELMALTKLHNCHILTVVHCNVGSEKARGHLGAEAHRKCETAITVIADGEVSLCKWTKTRDMCPPEFAFGISEGLPIEVHHIPKQAKTDRLQQIINDSMPPLPNTISYSDLYNKIIKVAGIKIDAAKKRVSTAQKNGLIIKNGVGMYHLPPKQDRENEVPF